MRSVEPDPTVVPSVDPEADPLIRDVELIHEVLPGANQNSLEGAVRTEQEVNPIIRFDGETDRSELQIKNVETGDVR